MRVPLWATTRDFLAAGLGVLRLGGPSLALVYVLSQAVVGVVAVPVLGWLVRQALASAGLTGIDAPQLGKVFAAPLSVGLFALVFVLGYLLVLAQLFLLLTAVRRVHAGESLGWRALFAEFGLLLRRLMRPSSLGLLPYLLILLPLSGFGFFSVITRTIAVPSFITGELTKSVPGIIGYVVFLLVLLVLCIRFALTLPLFAAARVSGGRASRLSWRLTKRTQFPLVIAVLTVLIVGVLGGFLILLLSITPTLLTDAVWPGASPAVAAIGLAVAVALGVLFMGAAAAMLTAVLLRCLERSLEAAPNLHPRGNSNPAGEVAAPGFARAAPNPSAASAAASASAAPAPKHRALATGATLVALALVAGSLTAPLMFEMSRQPGSLVLAHRGFDGVENTIAGLDGAHAAGSEFVEIDVMQTADEEFVVLHDADLTRLAGRGVHIADLTLEEATAITVEDLAGHRDRIPSLEDYLAHADAIDQKLLIEVKLHGRETDDFLERLVEQIEAQGVLEDHIYHSLDTASVAGLKRMRPALYVGYTMAFAGTALPETPADFVVIEEWSYSSDLNDEARRAGIGMFVWTVNDEMKIRQLLRDDVDGIITDHPDIAVTARDQMADDDGLAPVLFDAIMRFVTIF